MKTLKKALAIVLTLCSLAAFLSAGAWADGITIDFDRSTIYAGGTCTMYVSDYLGAGSNFEFTAMPTGVTITGYNGFDGTRHSYSLQIADGSVSGDIQVVDNNDSNMTGIRTITITSPVTSANIICDSSNFMTGESYPFRLDDSRVTATGWGALPGGMNSNGVFRCDTAGQYTITATGTNEIGQAVNIAPRIITVNSPAVSVTGVDILLNGMSVTSSIELARGTGITLTAKVSPDNATSPAVIWSVSPTDGSILTVNNGFVTRVADGNASVTVTTVDGGFSDTVYFPNPTSPTPTPTPTATPASGNFNLSRSEIGLTAGTTYQLYAYLDNTDVTGSTSWASNDTKIATVVNGKITAKSAGTTTIIASNNIGSKMYYETCTVTVTGVAINHQITYGNYGTFDGTNPLYFITNDYITNFKGVTVDGYALTNGTQYYSTSSSDGHILVALNPAYLKMLSSANYHTIQIVSNTSGAATGYFRTYGVSYNIYGVRTGDDNNIALWVTLCIIGFAGATAIVIKKRKDIFG